jgi:hypothetical protein
VLEQRVDVVAELCERHPAGGVRRAPVAAVVGHDEVEVLGGHRRQTGPSVQRVAGDAHPAVQEDEERRIGRPVFVVEHAHRPDVDVTHRQSLAFWPVDAAH